MVVATSRGMGSMGDDFQTIEPSNDISFDSSFTPSFTYDSSFTPSFVSGGSDPNALDTFPLPTLKPADFNSTQNPATNTASDPNALNWNNLFAELFGTAAKIVPALVSHGQQAPAPGSFHDVQQNGPGGSDTPYNPPGSGQGPSGPGGQTATLTSSPLFDPSKPYVYMIAGGALLTIVLLTKKSGRGR